MARPGYSLAAALARTGRVAAHTAPVLRTAPGSLVGSLLVEVARTSPVTDILHRSLALAERRNLAAVVDGRRSPAGYRKAADL